MLLFYSYSASACRSFNATVSSVCAYVSSFCLGSPVVCTFMVDKWLSHTHTHTHTHIHTWISSTYIDNISQQFHLLVCFSMIVILRVSWSNGRKHKQTPHVHDNGQLKVYILQENFILGFNKCWQGLNRNP